jgi:hypothetical protein
MAYGFVPIVHIVAAVLSIIELGLTGYGKLLSQRSPSQRSQM